MKLEEIVRTILRNRSKELALNMERNNALLETLLWREVKRKITVPEYIEGMVKGYYKMKDGKIYEKRKLDRKRAPGQPMGDVIRGHGHQDLKQ